jgi:hypothetical protein
VRTAVTLLLLVASPACLAQKWMDENGKVYYGTPPAGVRVKPVPMTGGASSSVGSQPSDPNFPPPQYAPVEPWQEQMRQQEYARRRAAEESRKAEQHQRDAAERESGLQLRDEERQLRRY